MNPKRIVRDFLLLAIIAAGHVCFLASVLLSPARLCRAIESELEQRLGMPFHIAGQHLSFPDTLELRGVHSTLSEQPGSLPWLNVECLRFELDPLQLLRGRIEIRKIEVSRPKIMLDLKARTPGDSATGGHRELWTNRSATPAGLMLDDISILDGAVTLLHLPGFGEEEKIEFDGIIAKISRIRGVHQGFRITGDLATQWLPLCGYRLDIDESAHILRGDINAEAVEISQDLFSYLPLKIRGLCQPYQLQGAFDLNFGFRFNWETQKVETLTLRADLYDCSARIQALPFPVEGIYGQLQTDGKNVLVREVTARLGSASIKLSGHRILGGLQAEESWNIRFQDLPLDENLQHSLKASALRLWEDVSPGGNLDAAIKVTREEGKPFRLTADLESEDMKIVYRQFPYPAAVCGGHIEWDGTTCLLRDIAASAGPTRGMVNGEIEPVKGGQKHLHVKVSRAILDNRFREALPKQTRGVWDMIDPSGTADGEYEYFKDREGNELYRVQIAGIEAAARYIHFPLPVSLLSGNVSWTENVLTLKEVRAASGSSLFKVMGELHPRRVRAGDRVTVVAESVKLDEKLRKVLPAETAGVFDQLQPEGKVHATLDLHGREDGTWRYVLNLQSDTAHIRYRAFPYLVRLPQCSVEWDAEAVRLLDIRCQAEEASIAVHGEITRSPEKSSTLRFDFQKLDLDSRLREALPKEAAAVWDQFQLQGLADGFLEVKFESKRAPRFELQARLENGSASYRRIPVAISAERIHLSWDAQGFNLHQFSGRVGEGSITVTATIPNTPGQIAQVDLSGKDLLLEDELLDSMPEVVCKTCRQFHVGGKLDVDVRLTWQTGTTGEVTYTVNAGCKDVSACYEGFPAPLSHLSGKLTVTNESLTISKLQGFTRDHPVTIEGSTVWSTGGARPDLIFEAHGIPLDEKFAQLLPSAYQELWNQLQPGGIIKKIRYQLHSKDSDEFDHQFTAELEDASLTYAPFPVPLSQVSTRLTYQDGQMRVEDFKGQALEGNVRASGIFRNGTMELDIATEGFAFNTELFECLPATVQQVWQSMSPSGSVDVSAQVKSAWNPMETKTDFQTVMSLKDVSATVGFLLQGITGIMRLKGQVSGEILDNLEGTAEFKRLEVRGEHLSDLTATLAKEEGQVVVKELRAIIHGGLLRADFKQDRQNDRTAVTLSFSNVNVADFASRFGGTSRLSGLARGDMQLHVQGSEVNSVRGTGALYVDGGELWELPTLDFIYSLLNFERKNRVRQLEMRYTLEGSEIQVQLLKLVGDEYNIYGYGKISLDWKLDLTLFIAKQSMLKDVVSAIPVAPITNILKTLFERIDASLYQVELKGPLDAKPQASPFKHSVPDDILEEMHKDGKKG